MKCVSCLYDDNISIHKTIYTTFTGDKSGTMTVDTALDLLQAAAAEIEEESEVHIKYLYASLFDRNYLN